MKYNGYDQQGILRVWVESSGTWSKTGDTAAMDAFEQGRLIAREYMHSRLDCTKITFRPLGKTGKPMLQGSFKIVRPGELKP